MTVGENIKKIRLQRNMTQKELGAKCGLADSAIRRYELGGANPKFETIQKIAEALGVSYTDLLGMKEYRITRELLTEYPHVKDNLIEAVLKLLDDWNELPLEAALKSGSIDEIVDILSNVVQKIEVNDNFDIINIYPTIPSKKDALLNAFQKLNTCGKNEAVKRVLELTEIKKYTT